MKLSIETCPTPAQLNRWWDAMQSEDLSQAFNDDFPRSLNLLLELCAQGWWDLKCLVDCQQHVAAMVWLHDITYREDWHEHVLDTGWLGGYYMPAYRGKLGVKPIELAMVSWRFRGLQHLFAAVHSDNVKSQRVLDAVDTLHHVGMYPGPTPFAGERSMLQVYATDGGDALAIAGLRARWAQKEIVQETAG